LPVPPFFCVGAKCFAEITAPIAPDVERLLGRIDFADRASIQGQSAAVAALVLGLELPPSLAQALDETVRVSFPAHARMSVRSSLVAGSLGPGEDSADDAFAGLSDSFLYVEPEAVVHTIKRVWASAFNPESLLYRHARGMALTGSRMAVGVQQMIDGRRSFVLFTRDPRTGANVRVIAAGHGIGEGVVQEKVAVDHFFVSPAKIERRVVHKPTALVRDAERGGVSMASVPEALRDHPALDDRELAQLVELGAEIHDLFGCPQDIEGTIDADGQVHVLQARPITMQLELRQLWSNANVTESFSGTTGALTYSFAQKFYFAIFRDLYRSTR
jgi:rifampicin phosphotransferase